MSGRNETDPSLFPRIDQKAEAKLSTAEDFNGFITIYTSDTEIASP